MPTILTILTKALLSENVAYLGFSCSVSFKDLWRLNDWMTKKEATGLKNYLHQISESRVLKTFGGRKKQTRDLTHNLRDASGL